MCKAKQAKKSKANFLFPTSKVGLHKKKPGETSFRFFKKKSKRHFLFYDQARNNVMSREGRKKWPSLSHPACEKRKVNHGTPPHPFFSLPFPRGPSPDIYFYDLTSPLPRQDGRCRRGLKKRKNNGGGGEERDIFLSPDIPEIARGRGEGGGEVMCVA